MDSSSQEAPGHTARPNRSEFTCQLSLIDAHFLPKRAFHSLFTRAAGIAIHFSTNRAAGQVSERTDSKRNAFLSSQLCIPADPYAFKVARFGLLVL